MNYLTKIGKFKTTIRIIADSISEFGNRMTTFELEYPRIIHAELMTHRVFSRNAMSSRAVPIKKMIEQVVESPARPYEFGKNKAGMQSAGAHDALVGAGYTAEAWWGLAALSASRFAQAFDEAGYHKQVANRLIEPFQMMKTVLTATEFANFFWLRIDGDADPTIRELAELMFAGYNESTPELLKAGQWHTPYVNHTPVKAHGIKKQGEFSYTIYDEAGKLVHLSLEDAKAISSSCCAQVSYRVLNATKEKALDVYGKLLTGKKVHASPFEHQATPVEHDNVLDRMSHLMATQAITQDTHMWEDGVTHIDVIGKFWSGNLKGWVQHRQLLPNHVFIG